MAATLHIVPSPDNFKKKRLHGELDLESINQEYTAKKRLKLIEKLTPPPSSCSDSPLSYSNNSLDHPLTSYTYNTNNDKATISSSGSGSEHSENSEPLVVANRRKLSAKRKPKRKVNLNVDTKAAASDTATHTTISTTSNTTAATVDSIENNVDYITLCSTLNLLYSQKQKVQSDIVKLGHLKLVFKSNPETLHELLVTNQLSNKIPSRNQVVKCPTIDFTKYGIAYQSEQDTINAELSNTKQQQQSLFKVSSPFGWIDFICSLVQQILF